MKTSALDFFMAIGVMLMILVLSLNLTGAVVAPLTRSSLGDYHVIADLLSFLLCYGILSGLVMRLIPCFAGPFGEQLHKRQQTSRAKTREQALQVSTRGFTR